MSLNYQGAEPGAPLTLTQAASLVQGRLDGDGSIQIHGLAPLDEAGPGEMAFLAMKLALFGSRTPRNLGII